MEFVCRSSPEVSDLLGLDFTRSERRTLQWRSWNLQNRQRRSVSSQRLCHSWDWWNKRRQRQALHSGEKRCNCSERVFHLDEKIWGRSRWTVEQICGNISTLIYLSLILARPQISCLLGCFPWLSSPTATKSTQGKYISSFSDIPNSWRRCWSTKWRIHSWTPPREVRRLRIRAPDYPTSPRILIFHETELVHGDEMS